MAGKSLRALLNVCRPSRIVLCDNWCYGKGRDELSMLLREQDLPARLLEGNSHEVLKTLIETFAFITIDGDHTYKGAEQDLEEAWPLLNQGGLLFFDDIFHPAHLYLDACVDLFVMRHSDAHLERKEFYRSSAPGCAVLQKQI